MATGTGIGVATVATSGAMEAGTGGTTAVVGDGRVMVGNGRGVKHGNRILRRRRPMALQWCVQGENIMVDEAIRRGMEHDETSGHPVAAVQQLTVPIMGHCHQGARSRILTHVDTK